MTVNVTKKENGLAVFSIEVAPEEQRQYLEHAAVALSKERPLAGFRPGHVPYDQATRAFGETAILEQALEDIVRSTFSQALEEQKLEAIGAPEIKVTKLAPGNPVSYEATIALIPEVTLPNWREIKVAKKKVEVTDDEVNKVIEDLRRTRATESVVDRPAALNDKVKLDLSLSLERVPLEGGQAKSQILTLGHAGILPGISEGIMGMKNGEEKTFPVKVPKDHHDKNLAGRTVEVKVALQDVFEVTLPAPDDALAQRVGKFSSFDDLKTKISENLQHDHEAREDERVEMELLDAIIVRTGYGSFPEALIKSELDKMLAELKGSVEGEGMEWTKYLIQIRKSEDEIRAGLRPAAQRRLKGALLLRALGRIEQIEVTEPEVTSRLHELEEQYKSIPELATRVKSEAYRDYQVGLIRNEKVLDFLKNTCVQ